jgi:hypothetical protein
VPSVVGDDITGFEVEVDVAAIALCEHFRDAMRGAWMGDVMTAERTFHGEVGIVAIKRAWVARSLVVVLGHGVDLNEKCR